MPISKNGLQCVVGLILALLAPSLAMAQAQYTTPYAFTTIAGVSATGALDGATTAATFARPAGIAFDRSGNLFVADNDNNTLREITPQGTVSTYAGYALAGASGGQSYIDGVLSTSRFLQPHAIVFDASGNMYVADTGNDVIRKIDTLGNVTTFAGTGTTPGFADGNGTAVRFNSPQGLAIDASGDLYVADTGNNAIRKITPAGVVTTLAGSANGTAGSVDGTGTAALFSSPRALAIDGLGNLYVTDTNNDTIRKVTSGGIVTTYTGVAGAVGFIDGAGSVARFNAPSAIVIDPSGNLFVADTNNNAVREVGAGAIVSTVKDVTHSPALVLSAPDGLAINSAGVLYAADQGNSALYSLSLGSSPAITLYAGNAGTAADVDGTGSVARFVAPYAMTLGTDGNLHVVEYASGVFRQVTPSGVVTTTGQLQLKPFLTSPGLVAIASGGQGDYYVSDEVNAVLYHVGATGSTTTVGDQNDYLISSIFSVPQGLVVVPGGSFYLTDAGNSAIFQGNAAGGQPTVFAGASGSSGDVDGPAVTARFNGPSAIAQDNLGNFYVADTNNHLIRKIATTGAVSTLAGTGAAGTQDGAATTAAQFIAPTSLAVDAFGNLYIFDQGSYTIRLYTASTGLVSTIGGLVGTPGGTDGTGPSALFNEVGSMSVDGQGNLYVSDGTEGVVKVGKVSATLTLPVIYVQPSGETLPTAATLVVSVGAGGPNLTYQWYLNGVAITGATGSTYTKANMSAQTAGPYTVVVTNPFGSVTSNPATVVVTTSTTGTGTSGTTTTTSSSGSNTSISPPATSLQFSGGGGGPSLWFGLALAALALIRWRVRPARIRL